MTESQVLVVGAGPVGMTVAALLSSYGISVRVIEQNATVCEHPRAQSIDDESLRTLAGLGIADRLMPNLLAAEGSRYYDLNRNCIAEVGRGPKNYGYTKRHFMLQQQLDNTLLSYLRDSGNVDVRFNCKVEVVKQDANRVSVKIASGEEFGAQYLLACDGGQSTIRTQLGIALEGETYERDWIVLDAIDDPDTEAVSRFFCDPERPTVSVASPNGGRRYEWMLRDGETSDEVLKDEFIKNLLTPFRPFDPDKITRRTVYRFHSRLASRFREGRVLLLGDAAHLSPPFAGQGMNAGIRDADNVAWKIAGLIQNGWKDSVLDSYEAERRGPVWAMIQLAVAMGEFVMPVGSEQIALTRSLMTALDRFPEAHDWLFQMKFKPKPRYNAGLFVDLNDQTLEASLVGEMIPQPAVVDESGRSELLDSVLGNGFALLAQDDPGEAALESLRVALAPGVVPQCVRLFADPLSIPKTNGSPNLRYAAWPPEHKDDSPERYERPLRTHRDQVLLIRPDRYVMAAFDTAEGSHAGVATAAADAVNALTQ